LLEEALGSIFDRHGDIPSQEKIDVGRSVVITKARNAATEDLSEIVEDHGKGPGLEKPSYSILAGMDREPQSLAKLRREAQRGGGQFEFVAIKPGKLNAEMVEPWRGHWFDPLRGETVVLNWNGIQGAVLKTHLAQLDLVEPEPHYSNGCCQHEREAERGEDKGVRGHRSILCGFNDRRSTQAGDHN
jgi:hypothetical protein